MLAIEAGAEASKRLQQVRANDLLFQPQTVQGCSADLIVSKACMHKSLLQRLRQAPLAQTSDPKGAKPVKYCPYNLKDDQDL